MFYSKRISMRKCSIQVYYLLSVFTKTISAKTQKEPLNTSCKTGCSLSWFSEIPTVWNAYSCSPVLHVQLYIIISASKDYTACHYCFSRSLYAVYTDDVTVKGITGYRFVPPFEVFANLTVNPANAGFCVPAGNCLGSGLLNISTCKQGGKSSFVMVAM